jgi:hypothetical protein
MPITALDETDQQEKDNIVQAQSKGMHTFEGRHATVPFQNCLIAWMPVGLDHLRAPFSGSKRTAAKI